MLDATIHKEADEIDAGKSGNNTIIDIPSPLPFHLAIVEHLEKNESALWKWFSNQDRRKNRFEATKLELLKTTYRIAPDSETRIHEIFEKAKTRLGCDLQATFYQAQQSSGTNASLIYIPGEIHIVFHGDVLSLLDEKEIEALVCHELGHYLFFEMDGGRFKVAEELLLALNNDNNATSTHMRTLTLYALYTELFCDRIAFRETDDFDSAVSVLIKLETGLSEVSSQSYLNQAKEILAKEIPLTEGFTHPECYIRAVALDLWREKGDMAYPLITPMIEGDLSLDKMNILSQKRIMGLTERLLEMILAPEWMRTPATLAHARLFFEGFAPSGQCQPITEKEIPRKEASLKQYLCYVMLDFAVTDKDLEDVSICAMLLLSERLGLYKEFTAIVAKELKPGRKLFDKLKKNAAEIVKNAGKNQ